MFLSFKKLFPVTPPPPSLYVYLAGNQFIEIYTITRNSFHSILVRGDNHFMNRNYFSANEILHKNFVVCSPFYIYASYFKKKLEKNTEESKIKTGMSKEVTCHIQFFIFLKHRNIEVKSHYCGYAWTLSTWHHFSIWLVYNHVEMKKGKLKWLWALDLTSSPSSLASKWALFHYYGQYLWIPIGSCT